MGVCIMAIKLGKKISKERADKMENYPAYVYTLDFKPIEHLTKFEEGYYEIADRFDNDFHLSYGGYNKFRDLICRMANKISAIDLYRGDINDYLDKPFIEMINFADNEGSFDYVVAEKLLNDFKKWDSVAKDSMEDFYDEYKKYMEILEACVEFKGIVYYC